MGCTQLLYSQQEAFFSQYRVNSFLFNPAIAGTKQTFDARAAYRSQWVGYSGAPTTSSISFHSRLYKGAIGLGGFAVQDQVGCFHWT